MKEYAVFVSVQRWEKGYHACLSSSTLCLSSLWEFLFFRMILESSHLEMFPSHPACLFYGIHIPHSLFCDLTEQRWLLESFKKTNKLTNTLFHSDTWNAWICMKYTIIPTQPGYQYFHSVSAEACTDPHHTPWQESLIQNQQFLFNPDPFFQEQQQTLLRHISICRKWFPNEKLWHFGEFSWEFCLQCLQSFNYSMSRFGEVQFDLLININCNSSISWFMYLFVF